MSPEISSLVVSQPWTWIRYVCLDFPDFCCSWGVLFCGNSCWCHGCCLLCQNQNYNTTGNLGFFSYLPFKQCIHTTKWTDSLFWYLKDFTADTCNFGQYFTEFFLNYLYIFVFLFLNRITWCLLTKAFIIPVAHICVSFCKLLQFHVLYVILLNLKLFSVFFYL